MAAGSGRIYAGIGGWNFAPWRGVFYPKGLPQARELAYASEQLTSIEINSHSTARRSRRPSANGRARRRTALCSRSKVRALRPTGACSRKPAIPSNVSGLRHHRARRPARPLLWQFAPTKKFDEADFGKFLELLPAKIGKAQLRHVVEVRHDSFCTPAFITLLRQFKTPVVFAEHDTYLAIADITGDFVYARLQRGEEKLKTGYPPRRWMNGPSARSSG